MEQFAPAARWAGSNVLDPSYLPPRADGKEKEDRPRPRLMKRVESQRELHAVVGSPVLFDTTILIGPHGQWIGECSVGGVKVRWSMWIPHKRLAIDIFPRQMPPPGTLEAKQAFADKHHIRYLVVPPTHSFGLDDLRDAVRGAVA